MKQTSIIAAIFFSGVTISAKELTIKVDNVKNGTGKILLMGIVDGVKEPLYTMVDAKHGEVTLKLENLDGEVSEISIFHDENNNFQLDMGNRVPIEGYVTQKCKLKDENTEMKLTIYYPAK